MHHFSFCLSTSCYGGDQEVVDFSCSSVFPHSAQTQALFPSHLIDFILILSGISPFNEHHTSRSQLSQLPGQTGTGGVSPIPHINSDQSLHLFGLAWRAQGLETGFHNRE